MWKVTNPASLVGYLGSPICVEERHRNLERQRLGHHNCVMKKKKILYCTEPLQFPVRPRASVREIKLATTKYSYTWTLSAINMLMSHEEITSNVSSRKDPAFTRLTKRKAGTTMKVTTHFHPCRQCVGSCFHKQRVRHVKDIHTDMFLCSAWIILSIPMTLQFMNKIS